MASNRTNQKNKSIFYIIPSTIYTSLDVKEGQVYYSKNIILNLETIFNLDNKKTSESCLGYDRRRTHQL